MPRKNLISRCKNESYNRHCQQSSVFKKVHLKKMYNFRNVLPPLRSYSPPDGAIGCHQIYNHCFVNVLHKGQIPD